MKKGMIAYEDVGGALNTVDGTYGGPNGWVDKDSQQDYVQLKKNSRSYGITTNLSFGYAGITLSAQIATSWGGRNTIDWLRNATSSTASIWGQPVYLTDMYDAVDNPNGKYPNMAAADFGGTGSDAPFWKVSSFRSYVRTLTIGYTVPKNLTRQARLESARVFVSGNPTLRTWALGVNLGF
jgi:hypothetical protein